MHTNKFSRVSAIALIVGSMVAAPAFAAGNGKRQWRGQQRQPRNQRQRRRKIRHAGRRHDGQGLVEIRNEP